MTFSKILILFFIFAIAVERIIETFFCFRKNKIIGKIYHGWTLPPLSIVHFSIGMVSIYELCRVDKINILLVVFGSLIWASGSLLRILAIKELGGYHSIHIEVRDQHNLKSSGVYAFLRHPYYFGVIMEIIGFPLIANAFVGYMMAVLVYIPFMLVRVHMEEKAMATYIGEEYTDYLEANCFFPRVKLFLW